MRLPSASLPWKNEIGEVGPAVRMAQLPLSRSTIGLPPVAPLTVNQMSSPEYAETEPVWPFTVKVTPLPLTAVNVGLIDCEFAYAPDAVIVRSV